MKILLAEDDHDLGNVLKEYLQLKGYDVIHAENGQLALDAFVGTQPDICVLDVMMPKLDGFKLREKVNQLPNKKDIPYILITAKVLDVDKIKGYNLGINDYVVKVIRFELIDMKS